MAKPQVRPVLILVPVCSDEHVWATVLPPPPRGRTVEQLPTERIFMDHDRSLQIGCLIVVLLAVLDILVPVFI